MLSCTFHFIFLFWTKIGIYEGLDEDIATHVTSKSFYRLTDTKIEE